MSNDNELDEIAKRFGVDDLFGRKSNFKQALIKWRDTHTQAEVERARVEHYTVNTLSTGDSRPGCACGRRFQMNYELDGHIKWQLATLKRKESDE